MYKFRPWIGQQYAQSCWGQRVLVLGDSHYTWDRTQPIDNQPNLTIDSIELIVSGCRNRKMAVIFYQDRRRLSSPPASATGQGGVLAVRRVL